MVEVEAVVRAALFALASPTAAAWVGAIGTVLTAVVALGFGGWAEVRLHGERQRTEAERRAARSAQVRAQAEQVAAWVEVSNVVGPPEAHTMDVHAVVSNVSNQPVWALTVSGRTRADEDGRQGVPGSPFGLRWRFDVLAPGQTRRLDLHRHFSGPGTLNRVGAVIPEGAALPLTFRDNAGAWWERDEDGVLVRLERPPPVRL